MVYKTNLNEESLKEYYNLLCTFQEKCGNHFIKLPKPIKYKDVNANRELNTNKVLKAYHNMATVWSKAGGVIPKLSSELIELLFTMGTNHLMFNRKRHS